MLILLILLQDVKIEEYGLTRSSLPIKEKEGGSHGERRTALHGSLGVKHRIAVKLHRLEGISNPSLCRPYPLRHGRG
jgi:hypothetical protein